MQFLIVNADDFGFTEDVSEAILEAMERGVVTSTSAMVCTSSGMRLLARHVRRLRGRTGVHLQLTEGYPRAPLAEVRSLATASGTFAARRRELGGLCAGEVEVEWRAQVQAFRECGLEPTHLDTHHHVHKEPAAFAAYCRIVSAYGVRARSCDSRMTQALRAAGARCPDAFVTADDLLARIDSAFRACGGSGTVEVMCHPGRDGVRGRELALLCDPALRSEIRQRGIELVPG